MAIVRRILWRVARLVAAATVLWALGVALERILAELEPPDVASWIRRDFRELAAEAGRRGLNLEDAWDAHDALRHGRPPAR